MMKRYVLLIVCAVGMIGCAVKTVTVAEVQRDTLWREKTRTERIFYRDTVTIQQRGDTILKDIVRWRERETDNNDSITHTLYIEKPTPYEVEVVRYKRSGWDRFCTAFFILFCAYLIARIVWRVFVRRM